MLQIGFPGRILIKDNRQYRNFIKLMNGKKNLYRTVYHFNNLKNGAPYFDDIIINQVYIDVDDCDKNFKNVVDLCIKLFYDRIKFRVNFSGRGFHIFIASLHENTNRKYYLTMLHNFIIEKYNIFFDDVAIHGNIKQLRRIENTVNIRSNLYCIPLTFQELLYLTLDEIKELAEQPRVFDILWVEGKEIKLDNIDLKDDINENHNVNRSNGEFKELNNVLPEPCIARILYLLHPTHEERFLLCLWLSHHFRGGKEIRDFNLNELIEKIISFLRTRNWDDYSEALNTAKSSRYQVNNIIHKLYNFVPNCQWRKSYNICIYNDISECEWRKLYKQ